MPHDHRTSREEFPLAEAKRLRAEGQSIQAVADAIRWSFAYTRRKLRGVPDNRDHASAPPVNGNLPAIPASQPIAAQPIAIHRSETIPWVSRGLQVAAEMLEAIDAYAQQRRLEKREVLDLALRSFFALGAGKAVDGDA